MIITSLGGSGEDSRSCFLICSKQKNILLDCGVRREIADITHVYPLLTDEIIKSLDMVILSHGHEDHVGALGYLHHLGYRGPIYGSKPCISAVPSFCKKWMN